MKLPPRFFVTFEGSLWRIRRSGDEKGFMYLIGRLFRGEDIGERALEHYGLRVTMEPDADQADDELDGLIDPPATAPSPR